MIAMKVITNCKKTLAYFSRLKYIFVWMD